MEYDPNIIFLGVAFIEFLDVLNFQYSTKIIKYRELVHKCIVFCRYPQFRAPIRPEVYAWTHVSTYWQTCHKLGTELNFFHFRISDR